MAFFGLDNVANRIYNNAQSSVVKVNCWKPPVSLRHGLAGGAVLCVVESGRHPVALVRLRRKSKCVAIGFGCWQSC